MKKPIAILVATAVLLGIFTIGFLCSATKKHLRAVSPAGDFVAFALPFQGSASHPLDGKMRVYLRDRGSTFLDKHQTNLPIRHNTHLAWIPGAVPPTFQIGDQLGTRMIWQVQGQKAVCVKGKEFLAPDPYQKEGSPNE